MCIIHEFRLWQISAAVCIIKIIDSLPSRFILLILHTVTKFFSLASIQRDVITEVSHVDLLYLSQQTIQYFSELIPGLT